MFFVCLKKSSGEERSYYKIARETILITRFVKTVVRLNSIIHRIEALRIIKHSRTVPAFFHSISLFYPFLDKRDLSSERTEIVVASPFLTLCIHVS